MTLVNPMTLAFWFTVIPDQIPKGQTPLLPMICAGVFIGTVAWVVTFAGFMAWAGRRRPGLVPVLADLLGGAILAGFAAVGFWRVLRTFI